VDNKLNTNFLKDQLLLKGWQQADLAVKLNVSEAAVSQWLSGEHCPQPPMLLRIAIVLDATIVDLLMPGEHSSQPLIAFRRKGQQVTTDIEENEALDQAYALEKISKFIQPPDFRVREIKNPELEYDNLERLAQVIRKELSASDDSVIEWRTLVEWFHLNGAVIIPVFWGARENHGNALHIHLPETGHTFVYINLDSEKFDFKFWLAHEMAHMLTPSLVGQERGEDFADAFAGSLLFPHKLAALAYRDAVNAGSRFKLLEALKQHAIAAGVSLFTVYSQCSRLADAKGSPKLVLENGLHQTRRLIDKAQPKIREELFVNQADAKSYLDISKKQFKTPFFDALQRYLDETADGAVFTKRVLHTSLSDAASIQEAFFARSHD
jgi:transcriptional regulator with XRE-family HTH domain